MSRAMGNQRPLTEQIEELKAKISLLEGDRKAYYENSQWTMKQNQSKVRRLRQENKELRKKLADSLTADDNVISKGFEDRPVERASMKNKTGRNAIQIMDQKVCDMKKRLNALRHKTAQKHKGFEELKTQIHGMKREKQHAEQTESGQNEEGQALRNLENRLDKAELKFQEAWHIRRTYEQIKAKLQQEALSFPNQLDAKESEIVRCRAELKDLKAMHSDAQISRDAAQLELRKQEEVVYSDRKKREIELQRMKKEADEKKMQHERIERRIAQRNQLAEEEGGTDKAGGSGEEQHQKITSYEEAFRRIKEATGVSDTWEVVERFKSQGETQSHLEGLQREAEKQIARLREDKQKLQHDFEEMKYSGEARLSNGQRLLEEFDERKKSEEQRRDESGQELDRCSKILVQVKSGVEHLAEKLAHLKGQKSHAPNAKVSSESDEYVLDLLSQSEEKLLKLLEDLDGKDLDELMKKMEDEEFHLRAETILPQYNTRIKLPQATRADVYDDESPMYDEDDSGEDEGDVKTRDKVKREAQQLVDQKTKGRRGGGRIAKKKKK